mgnify:FL=1
MRKIFLFVLLLCSLLCSAVAQAAQVTDVKWGLSKENVLRLVVDVTEQAGYAVNIEGNTLNLTVNAQKAGQIPGSRPVKSSIANRMQVRAAGSSTVISLPLNKSLSASDYKAFVLRKDPKTNRPFRVVLDITADKDSRGNATVAGPVVGNRPVISNTPVKRPVVPVTPVVKPEKKPEKAPAPKPEKKPEKAPTKSDYKTSGGLKGKVIVIDPGHGGSDPGAIGAAGTREKDITLAISKRVKEYLEDEGAKVYMTRTTDVDVYGPNASDRDELQARVDVGERNNADVFLSLHINSSVNKDIGGFSTYYYPKTNNDLRLAQNVQKKLADNFGVDDLGVRQANFYVVKRISMPAILVEMCFISNPKEEKLMAGSWFQKKTARLIVEGVEQYFK